MTEPNYITPEGARRLAKELDQLLTRDRPRVVEEVAAAAADGDRSENAPYIYGKKKLREIDRRVQFLTRRLDAANVVSEPAPDPGRAYFGAWVLVEDESGDRREYRIVGQDEVEPDRGYISWRSPLGRALLRKRTGEVAIVRRPAGETEVTLVRVRYEYAPHLERPGTSDRAGAAGIPRISSKEPR